MILSPFAIFVSALMKCVQIFKMPHFKTEGFVFLLLYVQNSLCILDISPLYNLKAFSPSQWLVFSYYEHLYLKSEVFSFDDVYQFLKFMNCAFSVITKKS